MFCILILICYLCNPFGAMAERLGTGLQNLLQRFDSASHLQKITVALQSVTVFYFNRILFHEKQQSFKILPFRMIDRYRVIRSLA